MDVERALERALGGTIVMSCNERSLSKGWWIIFGECIGGIGIFLMASWSGLWIVYDDFGGRYDGL